MCTGFVQKISDHTKILTVNCVKNSKQGFVTRRPFIGGFLLQIRSEVVRIDLTFDAFRRAKTSVQIRLGHFAETSFEFDFRSTRWFQAKTRFATRTKNHFGRFASRAPLTIGNGRFIPMEKTIVTMTATTEEHEIRM